MATFLLNDRAYETDEETLQVLRGIMPSAKATGDSSAVMALILLGEHTGRIRQIPGR
jgi:hypothetical protein